MLIYEARNIVTTNGQSSYAYFSAHEKAFPSSLSLILKPSRFTLQSSKSPLPTKVLKEVRNGVQRNTWLKTFSKTIISSIKNHTRELEWFNFHRERLIFFLPACVCFPTCSSETCLQNEQNNISRCIWLTVIWKKILLCGGFILLLPLEMPVVVIVRGQSSPFCFNIKQLAL